MNNKHIRIAVFSIFIPLVALSCSLFASRPDLKFDPATLPDARVGVPHDSKIAIVVR
jgi:hypothetical protein